jgi:hypothetical protein
LCRSNFSEGKTILPFYCTCRIQVWILIRYELLCELLVFLLHNIGKCDVPTISDLSFCIVFNSLFLKISTILKGGEIEKMKTECKNCLSNSGVNIYIYKNCTSFIWNGKQNLKKKNLWLNQTSMTTFYCSVVPHPSDPILGYLFKCWYLFQAYRISAVLDSTKDFVHDQCTIS